MSRAAGDIALVPPRREVYPERADRKRDWLEKAVVTAAGLAVAPASDILARLMSRIIRLTDAHAEDIAALTDAGLQTEAEALRFAFRRAGLRDRHVGRSFALVRETADRLFAIRHHNVQLIGGYALLRGTVAEMQTGEGKTLTATLAAATSALAGRPVHVITVNDYLVQRDAEKLRPLYEALGLTIGVVIHGMEPHERRAAYGCDVVYCTNKELAFDYLRDQMVLGGAKDTLRLKAETVYAGEDEARMGKLVLRGLSFAIIDEADSVLIDEARTPLIISADADVKEELQRSELALDLAGQLRERIDYRLGRNGDGVELTASGKQELLERTSSAGRFWNVAILREELITQALAALHLFHRDQHYLVDDGKIVIVDEYTGRVMPDRSWSEGLHQLIEVKEGCEPTPRRITLARITYQRLFRRFEHLAGMTGTGRQVTRELWSVFGLAVVRVPTNKPCRRLSKPTHFVQAEADKWRLIADRAQALQQLGAAVLIGTRSVAASMYLSAVLRERAIDHRVLNANEAENEAAIVAEAGGRGRITVATNMAGRGTDIVLAPGVAETGGLHVIISEMHDASRIDHQLAGRSARQGDPGAVERILSLEDQILEFSAGSLAGRALLPLARLAPSAFGPILFSHAQRRAERIHWRMRRDLLKLDERLGEALAFSGRAE